MRMNECVLYKKVVLTNCVQVFPKLLCAEYIMVLGTYLTDFSLHRKDFHLNICRYYIAVVDRNGDIHNIVHTS